tara:strand:+ start:76 stop:2286 length:2211 start_codon:yes stop_codon:yes gene_type:complete
MSLNKVLNRPMFRKEALRRGVLKTINANTGIMVGQPTSAAQVPALRKPPTFMERMSVSGPSKFAKGIFSIPGIAGYYAGDKVGQALGIESELGRMPFGLAGGYAASKALPALASAPALTSAALLAGPAYLTIAGAKERERIAKMSPKEREAHRQKTQQFGMSYLSDEDFNTQFGTKPKSIEEKVAEDKKIIEGRKSNRLGFQNRSSELKAEGDPLLQDNVAKDDVANLDAVQENSIMGSSIPPGEKGGPGFVEQSDVTTATTKDDKDLSAVEKKTNQTQSTTQGNNEINVGGPTNDPVFNQRIELAKKYTEELEKGQSSQAKLVFLANLASGLLTGTTKKSGIGGALEVFGQAIGPAVNNYATIRLKEGELRAKRREAGLNAAFEHMKFLNDAAKSDDIDRNYGVVQIRGTDGKLRNYKAYQRKGGTIEMATTNAEGQEVFSLIPQGGPIKDSGPDGIPGNEDDRVIGQVEDFLPQKLYTKELQKIEDTLGNRYAALATTREVLRTLNKVDQNNDQVKAGAALSIDTFFRRATGVAKDILQVDLTNDVKEAAAQAERFEKDELNRIDEALDNGEITESQATAERNLVSKERIQDQILQKIKEKGGAFSGLSGADQEKLAVQEVTLVYALANTFKDQDRLTQRDINAAREIVNIFSLARSSKDVRDSITAIGDQLEADINRYQIRYTKNGGLESSLNDLRAQENYVPFERGTSVSEGLLSDFDTEEKIKNELDKMEL